jgi:hypothetical protein
MCESLGKRGLDSIGRGRIERGLNKWTIASTLYYQGAVLIIPNIILKMISPLL